MRLNSILFYALFLACLIGFVSCQNDTPATANAGTDISTAEVSSSPQYEVAPPLKGVDVAFHHFEMKPTEAKTIELENGTSIEIPANAFVDKNGNPITEDVEIRYREFHTAADVLASGIPMKVQQEDGKEAYMQTAGMFEINAYVAELPVYLAEEKTININMASHVDGEYDFWNYDANAGTWINAGKNQALPNPKKAAARTALAVAEKKTQSLGLTKPIRPIKFDKSKPVLNFDVNYKAFPELQR